MNTQTRIAKADAPEWVAADMVGDGQYAEVITRCRASEVWAIRIDVDGKVWTNLHVAKVGQAVLY